MVPRCGHPRKGVSQKDANSNLDPYSHNSEARPHRTERLAVSVRGILFLYMFPAYAGENESVRHICICTLRRAFCAKEEARC